MTIIVKSCFDQRLTAEEIDDLDFLMMKAYAGALNLDVPSFIQMKSLRWYLLEQQHVTCFSKL